MYYLIFQICYLRVSENPQIHVAFCSGRELRKVIVIPFLYCIDFPGSISGDLHPPERLRRLSTECENRSSWFVMAALDVVGKNAKAGQGYGQGHGAWGRGPRIAEVSSPTVLFALSACRNTLNTLVSCFCSSTHASKLHLPTPTDAQSHQLLTFHAQTPYKVPRPVSFCTTSSSTLPFLVPSCRPSRASTCRPCERPSQTKPYPLFRLPTNLGFITVSSL